MQKLNLKTLSEPRMLEFMERHGQPAYRARQILQWIYERGIREIGEITVFSKALRESLDRVAYISSLDLINTQTSMDGTEKYLFGLEDGLSMESVLIPDEDRLTLCVSSQVGCQMGCSFCRTASMGFIRNLQAHEIVDQLIATSAHAAGRRISNIVFMGMGEPLMNLDNVVEAISRINTFMKLSRRRITVSTSGVCPKIPELQRLLSDRGIYVNLAISLNATTDEVRSGIMPVNRKYPLKELMEAVRSFPLSKTRNITFEYVLISDLNDSHEDARRLGRMLRGIPNKINIIPMNEFEGCDLRRPSDERIDVFQGWLKGEGLTALVRKSKGQDILASCGQLASRD
ncbi:23S rRNA (adenine(2503)-C(2))-methyltransferase RlmN [Nitrospirota bacterium]